jgi:hypothetical protein
MEERYEGRLLEYLTDAYGVAGYDTTGLGDALLAVASEMTEENLEEAMDGLFYEVKGSFLEEMDADSIRVNFRNLMVDSLFYTLARRCGLDPMDYLEAEDFVGITDFNDLRVLAFLGNAVNNPERPFVAILGGSKVSSKISVIDNLIDKVDVLIIGGGMAYTFAKAAGGTVGDSLLEMDYLDYANKMKEKLEATAELNTGSYLCTDVITKADSRTFKDWKIPFTEKSFIVQYDGIVKAVPHVQ